MRIGKYLTSLTMPEIKEIQKICNFNEEESMIVEMLSKNKSQMEISEKMKLSLSTTKRRVNTIGKKVERMVKITIEGKEVNNISDIKLSDETIRLIRTSVQN